VHEVEQVGSIEITRRGEPVAVLVSKIQFDRMQSEQMGFWKAYQSFKKKVDLENAAINPDEIWNGVRDRSRGRELNL
jgi:antitoxin (DNA-binding transcriptional repressor) of toxin-antitoxin stability system